MPTNSGILQAAAQTLPDAVRINAWTGTDPAVGALDPDAARWGSRPGLPPSQAALPLAAPADPADWAHSDVGYGIVVPDVEDPALGAAEKAAGVDVAAPIRDLIAARPGAVLLRWRADLRDVKLRRYYPDGGAQDVAIGLSTFGVAKGRLPRYLLLIASPATVPWSFQYACNTRHAVGRLPFDPDQSSGLEAIGNYLTALIDGWPDDAVDVTAPLLWSVDHGSRDITTDMRAVIAVPLASALNDPALPGRRWLDVDAASGTALLAELMRHPPGLLVTSSHGRTFPLDDAATMAAHLGLPVDAAHQHVALDDLVAAMPPGCVWFSQACCSAGSDVSVGSMDGPTSRYAGLLAAGTSARAVVEAVAGLGATVAPAALQLLGRPSPVRAVLGQVEPTFDWTLRVAETGQGLGGHLVAALSSHLHYGQPVGLAFADYRAGVGELHTQWAALRDVLIRGDLSVRAGLTRLRLTAMDRQSLVLLGDPTVTLPPVPGLRS